MNRASFQRVALHRIKDARILLAAKRWSASYYLSGYAVECALKACIAKMTKRYDFPEKTFLLTCYTHDLLKLLGAAKLEKELRSELEANGELARNYSVVKDWNEHSRYETWLPAEARSMVRAVSDKRNGVFTWIKTRW